MECNKSHSNVGLKQRLSLIFRSKSILRSSCNSSSSHTSNANIASTPSRRALITAAVIEPTYIPRRSRYGIKKPNIFSSCNSLPFSTKKERRVRQSGEYYQNGGHNEGRTCPPSSPTSILKSLNPHCCNNVHVVKSRKKFLLSRNAYGFTSSSTLESDGEFVPFTDEERCNNEEHFSANSRSFSSDSSEFYRRSKSNNNAVLNSGRRRRRRRTAARKECESSWGICREIQPVVSVNCANIFSETKKKRRSSGFAVMKNSNNPYNDFRDSMVEMIIERQIFGAEELEKLLQCYLSLNSSAHQPVILQAFSDIWVVLFGH